MKVEEFYSGSTKIEIYNDFIPTSKIKIKENQVHFIDTCQRILTSINEKRAL